MSTAVVGYIRVSTENQSERGVSLQAQRARVRSYCAAHGLQLLRVEEDAGLSAKTTRRAGLQSALGSLRVGVAEGLVTVKLDRLSRTTRDVLDLVARADGEGWALHSIEERLDTGSPHGRFVLTVLAGLAQMEREQVGARTKAALAHKRQRRERISGRVPYGWDLRKDGTRLRKNRAEQRSLALMRRWLKAGHTYAEIARRLNAAGVPAKLGGHWTRTTARTTLLRAARA